jgi:hypothetical protein
MYGMTKMKVTVTLDRSKAENARSLVGAASTSEVLDIALDRLIHAERLRRDVAAYRRVPPSDAEVALSLFGGATLDDDTDWEALYDENEA